MKPGRNHLTRKGGLKEFVWRYYERKVGNYLDLYTPLTASPDGKLGWRTQIVYTPREWTIGRVTWDLRGGSLRRERAYPTREWAVLTVGSEPELMRKTWAHLWARAPLNFAQDRSELQKRFVSVLAGCAEQGRFEPLVDYTIELFESACPTVARLFTESGVR